MTPSSRKLTDRQRRFIGKYLINLNAVQAAIRAGYAKKSAQENAYLLLRRPGIATAIQAAMAERAERTHISQDRVLEELAAVAFFDPADVASIPLNGPEDFARLPKHARAAIAGWGWNSRGNFLVKLTPKTQTLVALAKHLGLFIDIKLTNMIEHQDITAEPLAATARWLETILDGEPPGDAQEKTLRALPNKRRTS